MKELSIEEKAKAYDMAINKIMDYRNGNTKMYTDVNKAIDYLFPELVESEDEKVKKALIEYFNDLKEKADYVNSLGFAQEDFVDVNGYGISDFISWLEKQGSAKWCDEDEKQGKQKPADKVEPKFTVGDGF